MHARPSSNLLLTGECRCNLNYQYGKGERFFRGNAALAANSSLEQRWVPSTSVSQVMSHKRQSVRETWCFTIEVHPELTEGPH